MVISQARHGGFTLIELMIGVAIMALLLLAAAPFTMDWVDSARQMRARSNLIEAVGQARALAMRNPEAVSSGVAVAAVLYQPGQNALCVVTRESGAWLASTCLADGKSCADKDTGKTATGVSWLGCISSPGNSLAMKVADVDFLCAAYDSRGRQLDTTDLVASACVSPDSASVSITAGSQEGIDVSLL